MFEPHESLSETSVGSLIAHIVSMESLSSLECSIDLRLGSPREKTPRVNAIFLEAVHFLPRL